ncbi:MAG: omptin family outer membrane protease [Treponema sp.]|jgi:outer membrane protease|nr:omptin family outer membrane protease [Treponema sp.]
MKNITVLTVLVITFLIFAGFYPAYSEESPPVPSDEALEIQSETLPEKGYTLLIGTFVGFVTGEAYELVYPMPGYNGAKYLSELIWDMRQVFYLGLGFELNPKNPMNYPGFFVSGAFRAGLPGDSGFMRNRDWLSSENDKLTDFSRHINRTNEFFWADAAVGVSLPIKPYFYTRQYISGSWMRFSFMGRDGYGEYVIHKSIKFIGDSIEYEQNWLLIALGFSLGTRILYPFIFDLSLQLSPLAYCAARDHHLLRDTVFLDYTYFGFYVEPLISVSYVNKLIFTLEIAYRYISDTKGDTYMNEKNSDWLLAGNKSGAGLSLFDLRLLVKVQL